MTASVLTQPTDPVTDDASTILVLLAGGGPVPAMLAAAAAHRGWKVHVVSFQGQPKPEGIPLADKPQNIDGLKIASHKEFALGQIGHILGHLKALKATHVSMIGHLSKPSILSLKPDAMGLKLLAGAMMRHDDALLRSVSTLLEEEGFAILGVADLAPALQAPEGLLTATTTAPTADEEDDIALARSTLAVLGDLDIGQAVIVHKGTIVGVEAVEGTDDLIARCAHLRGDTHGGILVKRAKLMQTELADLPCVGSKTLELLAKHGYRGMCIQAGKTLFLNREDMLKIANGHKMFVRADA
jgi:DUF1009 family protein